MFKMLLRDILFSKFLFLPFFQIHFGLLIVDFKVLIIVRIILKICVFPETVHSSSSLLPFLYLSIQLLCC